MGMNWGQTLFIGLIVQEFFWATLWGKNKIKMVNFHFEDQLDPKIHPQKDSLGMNWRSNFFVCKNEQYFGYAHLSRQE